jgi:hypothetical protein
MRAGCRDQLAGGPDEQTDPRPRAGNTGHKDELANHHTEPGTSRRELAPDPLNSIME